MKTQLTFNILYPVRVEQADVEQYCETFGLSLDWWMKEGHRLIVVVNGVVTPERHAEIALQMSSFLASKTVTPGTLTPISTP